MLYTFVLKGTRYLLRTTETHTHTYATPSNLDLGMCHHTICFKNSAVDCRMGKTRAKKNAKKLEDAMEVSSGGATHLPGVQSSDLITLPQHLLHPSTCACSMRRSERCVCSGSHSIKIQGRED